MIRILIPLFFILVSCSKQPPKTEAGLVISLNSIATDLNFSGGLVVKLVNQETQEEIIKELSYPYTITIFKGIWNFYLVG